MIQVAVVYHSGYGHTAKLAEAVYQGVCSVAEVTGHLIKVEDVDAHWDDLAAADAIIFGAPTYMGSAAAPFKVFMDATSKVWMVQGWKDKIAAGFTNSASRSGDKLNTLVQMAILAAQQSMIWVGTGLLPGNNHSGGSEDDLNRIGSSLGVMAQSNADEGPDVAPRDSDLKTGAHLGQRVAELTHQFARGRQTQL